MASVLKRYDKWYACWSDSNGVQRRQSTKIRVNGKRSEQEALQIAIDKERKSFKVSENRLELNDVLQAIEGFSGNEKDLLAVALSAHLPEVVKEVVDQKTYVEVRDQWLTKLTKKSKRWVSDELLYNNRFIAFIGEDKFINNITVEDVDDYIKDACDQGKAPNTITNYLKPVKQLLDYAVGNGFISTSPYDHCQKPGTETTREFEYIPDDILDKVIANADDQDKIFWTWLRYTALNPKDVSRIEPNQIEKDDVGDGYHINNGRAKNGRLQRIPIHKNLQAVIDKHGDAAFGIYKVKSSRDNSNRRFSPAIAVHGIKSVLGLLRHTCLTNLLKAGLSLDQVALIAGHVDTKMLKKVYIKHVDQLKAYEAINRLK
jgi:integrase